MSALDFNSVRDDENWSSAQPAAVLALEHLARLNDRRHSEAMFRRLANTMPQIIWTGAADGRMDYWNDQAFTYSGRTFEELTGWKWHTLLHRDDRRRTVRVWREALREGRTFEINYRIRRGADGAYRWHLGRGFPIRAENGCITRWIGTCTDIHDQIEAQEQLDEAQRLAHLGSWHVDLATRKVTFSTELVRILGFQTDPPVNFRSLMDRLHPGGSAGFMRAAREARQSQHPLQFWHRLPDTSGNERLLHHRVQIVTENGKTRRLFGTVQDMTNYPAPEMTGGLSSR